MDWFTPLDGCPRCGYAFEREPGYFLFALWVVNFFSVVFVALSTYVAIEVWFDLSLPLTLALTMGPAPFLSFAVARHAKALFIAVDHFIDPFAPEDGGDDRDGGPPLRPEPPEDAGAPAVAPEGGRKPEPVGAGKG